MTRKQSGTDRPRPARAGVRAYDAHSHLPKPVERLLLKRYGGSALGRIASAGTLRALSVLVRKHPKAALDVLASGTALAGRISWEEIKRKLTWLTGRERPAAAGIAASETKTTSDPLPEKSAADKPRAQPVREADSRRRPKSLKPGNKRLPADTEGPFPPELIEVARRELEAELGERELKRARRLLHGGEPPS